MPANAGSISAKSPKSLLADLKAEPFVSAKAKGPEELAALLAALRRETIDKPGHFRRCRHVRTGRRRGQNTRSHQRVPCTTQKSADVVEVGCNGMCSDEPIVDIQIPGCARVSFGSITADKVPRCWRPFFFRIVFPMDWFSASIAPSAKAWDGVPYLDEHPFLAHQVRVVLASSGIIDPSNIDEYIARGGYSSIAKILRTMTPDEVCDQIEAERSARTRRRRISYREEMEVCAQCRRPIRNI